MAPRFLGMVGLKTRQANLMDQIDRVKISCYSWAGIFALDALKVNPPKA